MDIQFPPGAESRAADPVVAHRREVEHVSGGPKAPLLVGEGDPLDEHLGPIDLQNCRLTADPGPEDPGSAEATVQILVAQ
jgi:hypothetical protein